MGDSYGGVDPDEAPAQAVVREVFETGLRVRPVRVIGVFGGFTVVNPSGDVIQPYCTLFECKVVGGWLEVRDSEALAFRYVPAGNVPRQLDAPPNIFEADFTGGYFAWDEGWLEKLTKPRFGV